VRCAGKAAPERDAADSWGTVPPVVGTVLGAPCCEGVVDEAGGASIFMALLSGGACVLDGLVSA
jgi:hypothetical protein